MNLFSSLLRASGCAALGVVLTGVRADPPREAETPAAIASPGANTAPAPAQPAATGSDSRDVSADTAAILAARMPRYAPPPKPPPPKAGEEQPDLRDLDKPKNEIIRLPKFYVRAAKPPIFREQDIYNAKGLADLAVRRYLTEFDAGILNRLTVPLFGASAESRALQQYEEDLRLANIAKLTDTADSMSRGGDPAEGLFIKKAVEDTYQRGIDWGGTVPAPH